ncbi:MAG: hypothetical protein KatS3mg051_1691 [Anaerolineae bacterium]|nr:MAG: hypothetical protein KatS3mg051_1691 [Anaerolineae bacterium]
MATEDKRYTIYVPHHLQQWAGDTGNASRYIRSLMIERQQWWDSALAVVERLGRAAVLAIYDAMSSHGWTPGVAARDQILSGLMNPDWLREQRVSDAYWGDLIQRVDHMDHSTADALRVLCMELDAGRELPAAVGTDA